MSNAAQPNRFCRRLLVGETLIGSWCELASPISTEILGLAGFYWLVLDGEHAPNDITTFVPQLMALKGSHSVSVVRSALYSDSMASEQLDNVRRMLLAMVEDFRCVVLKLAERIMNLREMKDVPEAGR